MVTCDKCGSECKVTGCGTGYGVSADGARVCYQCCGQAEEDAMRADGKATLYLVRDAAGKYEVTNWPGTLRIAAGRPLKGGHNIARTRYDVWFEFDGWVWWGVQYGEWTQVLHCKRTKEQVRAPRLSESVVAASVEYGALVSAGYAVQVPQLVERTV